MVKEFIKSALKTHVKERAEGYVSQKVNEHTDYVKREIEELIKYYIIIAVGASFITFGIVRLLQHYIQYNLEFIYVIIGLVIMMYAMKTRKEVQRIKSA